jgi:hypothetical protein
MDNLHPTTCPHNAIVFFDRGLSQGEQISQDRRKLEFEISSQNTLGRRRREHTCSLNVGSPPDRAHAEDHRSCATVEGPGAVGFGCVVGHAGAWTADPSVGLTDWPPHRCQKQGPGIFRLWRVDQGLLKEIL